MPKNSLLWEITGNGLKKPSYLYGTIHIQDKRVYSFDNTVNEIFNSCEAYAMEVILDEIDPLEVQDVFQMKKTTLKSLLDEDMYAKLQVILQEKIHIPIGILEKTKPMFVASQLAQYYEHKDMPYALDMHFLSLAREKKMIVIGLETLREQLNAVKKISLKEQCKMLIELIKNPDEIEDKFNQLLNAYLKPDFGAILKLATDKNLPENFSNVFLEKRNKVMTGRIAKYIKKSSTFNAVGAGHLIGKKGVLILLSEKGFTVKPLNFSFLES